VLNAKKSDFSDDILVKEYMDASCGERQKDKDAKTEMQTKNTKIEMQSKIQKDT
jgi:hypothetical protein